MELEFPASPGLQVDSLPTEPAGKPERWCALPQAQGQAGVRTETGRTGIHRTAPDSDRLAP